MKLEVGMWVRTKYNGISKIVDYINDPTHYFFKCYKLDRDYINCEEYITETDVLKASHSLLGNDEEPCLIEVGDYVNGYKVARVQEVPNKEIGKVVVFDCGNVSGWEYEAEELYKHEIKSIVTKEQFEQMQYKVGD